MARVPFIPEQIGDHLGSYELLRLIGEGSMGRVFAARHQTLGRQVAIKVLRPEHALDDRLVQRFFREARAVNQINHRHIVEVFDFVEPAPDSGDRAYCVMEQLEGQTLGELFAAGGLPLSRALPLFRQIASALAAAHAVGVVHRDLKPENIVVVTRDGQDFAKVLDFGVAKLLTPDPAAAATVDGAVVGTPQYMAPEQAASLDVDARADVYGLGCLLYQALSGSPPFPEGAFGQLLVQIITQPPEPLPARTPAGEPIPDGLATLVARCLEKEPALRPQSMEALDAELSRYADPASLARARRRERNTRLLVAVGASAVLAAGLLLLPHSGGASGGVIDATFAAPSAGRVTVQLESDPPGATVVRTDQGETLGTTPLSLDLAASDEEIPLRFEHEGFAPTERRIRPHGNLSLEVALSRAVPAAAVVKGAEAGKGRVTRDAVVDPFTQ